MYLRGSRWRMSKRRRRRSNPFFIVVLVALISAAVYVNQVVVPEVPPLFVPTPTPTRSPESFVNEGREAFDTALTMGEEVLRELGYPAFEVHRAAKRFRQHDTSSLREIYAATKESPELGIDAAIHAREALEKLFAEDSDPLRTSQDESWS